MKTFLATVVATTVCLSISGCTQPSDTTDAAAEPGQQAIIQVNGMPMTENAFAVYAKNRTNRDVSDLTQDERTRLIDEATQLLVVAQAAKAKGLADTADIRGSLELHRLNTLAQNLIRTYMEDNPVTDDDLAAEYVKRQAETKPLEYKARHILVADEETAISLIAQLDYGSDFAELARENSTGPSASSGGDLGWFTADQMVAPFSEAVASMEKGTYTKEPVQTRFGWHVILAEDVRDSTPAPLEQIKEQLRPQLQQQAIESYIEGLKSAATIEKF